MHEKKLPRMLEKRKKNTFVNINYEITIIIDTDESNYSKKMVLEN